jgi:hypothetical protein
MREMNTLLKSHLTAAGSFTAPPGSAQLTAVLSSFR